MAAAAALFEHQLNDLDRTNIDAHGGLRRTAAEVDNLGGSMRRGTSDLNQYTGRLGLWRDAILTIGPGLIPIGAVGIPALTGLASAFGFAAAGATASIVAFQGVGDALKTMRKVQLEPTAANLQAARQAMEQIGEPAQDFVTRLLEMGPALKAVRDASAEGLFSELTPALDDLEDALPRVASLFGTVSEAMGRLGAEGIESLTGPEWADFFSFIEAEAPDALETLGSAVGSLAHGFAELWMALGPVNRDFTEWLRDSADAFDDWAAGLSQTDGFSSFVDYLRENGPKVAAAGEAIGDALVQIVQAAAPLGGPTLTLITRFADALATLADSPLGTPLFALAAGLAAVSRAAKGLEAVNLVGFGSGIQGMVAKAGAVTGFALALEGLANTAKLLEGFGNSATLASRGVEDIASALQDSAVGTHASDLGIDIQRLSEDLAANGAQGEYVKQVMADLSEQSGFLENSFDALNGANEALTLVGFDWGKNANEAKQASLALADVAEQYGLISNHEIGSGLDDLLGGFMRGTDAARGFKEELLSLNDVLAGRANMRDYEAAIDAATEALKRNGKTLDRNTAAGRENEAALDNIATTALRVAEGMDKADRKDFLRDTRDNLTQAAVDFGMTKDRADALARRLLGLPKAKIEADDGDFRQKAGATEKRMRALNFLKANPKVDANDAAFQLAFDLTKRDLSWLERQSVKPTVGLNDQASGPLGRIKNLLDGLHDKSITVTTYRALVHSPTQQAQGGYIAGPGGPTDDRIPAMLSNGEFVMKAAAVQRYGIDAMYAMNEMRLAAGGLVNMTHAKRFANGGSVSGFDATFVAADISRGLDSIFVPWQAIMRQELRAAKELAKERQAEVDAIRDHRNALRDSARSLRDSVAGKFAPSADLLGEGFTVGGVTSALAGLGNQASMFGQLTLRLKAMGLDGAALQWLIDNATSPDQLQAFVNSGVGQLAAFESTFNQSAQAQQQAGQNAVFATMGQELARVTAELRESREDLRQVRREVKQHEKKMERYAETNPEKTGQAVGRQINRVAARAQRRPQ